MTPAEPSESVASAASAAPVVRLVALREDPLDVAEVLAAVDDDAAGGVGLFVGRVRDHDHDQSVRLLNYSAHPSAVDQMRAVCDEVAQEYGARAVAATHRIGRLEIGDLAVVVGVAAAHRGEAMDGARALIDRLKATVPIWKHQVFTDGADEWVGTP